MTNNVPNLLVAVADHAAIVKVNGRANFTTSVSFKRLILELKRRGFHNFILDLSECVTMDSTFLGVLAGTALKFAEPAGPASGPPGPGQLRLVNPNQRVLDLLDNLGVSDLFQTVQCDLTVAPDAYSALPEGDKPSRAEVSKTCLEAHLLLMDLNPENVVRFKDVANFLAEDLNKLTATPEPAKENPDQVSADAETVR